jgi:hypothetical protein
MSKPEAAPRKKCICVYCTGEDVSNGRCLYYLEAAPDIKALQARVKQLEAYAQHAEDCRARTPYGGIVWNYCNCGLDKALQQENSHD